MGRLVYVVFFFSGLAGLMYEISWTRQIGLLFGHTSSAAAIVLVAYFSGMAVGYVLSLGKVFSRMRPLRAYAFCEIFAAAWALLVPLLLESFRLPVFAALLNSETQGVQIAARSIFAFLLLLPATAALGASLPFIAEYFEGDQAGSGKVVLAYAVNTLGAFIGVLATTFFLMIYFGVARSSYVAALVSALCGAAAFYLDPQARQQRPRVLSEKLGDQLRHRQLGKWLILSALSGFATLALQILYTRLFSLIFHNSSYSFGCIVAVFIVAIALGARLSASRGVRENPLRALIIASQLGAVTMGLGVLFFTQYTELNYFETSGQFWTYISHAFGLVMVVVLTPVTILSLVLPSLWQVASESSGSAKNSVALLTATNTLAAAAGALITNFFLLPNLGLWASFGLAAVILILGPWMVLRKRFSFELNLSGLVSVAAVAAIMLMTAKSEGIFDDEELVQRWESSYGWVDVVRGEENNKLELRQNIHYGLGSTGAIAMEKRQARIPLLLHPNPQKVLMLGAATGITVGGALDHPEVRDLTVVELLPDVVEASRLFKTYNRNYLEDPRTKVVVNDARHFLYGTKERFDVVISDLFVPWESMTGYLYTREHYQAALQSLNPGGIFCQWLPLWQVSAKEMNIIADTFAAVFPKTTIWFGKIHPEWTIVGFVGSREELNVDSALVNARMDLVNQSFADRSLKSARDLVRHYAGDWIAKDGVEWNTDEHPVIEFSTPISAWSDRGRLKFRSLLTYLDETFRQPVFKNLNYHDTQDTSFSADDNRRYRDFIFSH